MRTAVITVGKEVLTGKTVNTNLATISRMLNQIGIDTNRSFVIDDQKEEYYKILDFIDEELIIFTGGLGPTIDDISRETVIDYFGVDASINQEVLKGIKEYFDQIGLKMDDTNNKQAYFPKKSVILHNDLGTAPGVIFSKGEKTIILFPGPPHELLPMLKESIEYLKKKLKIRLYSKGFRMVGIGESVMEKALIGFYELHPNVNIAPYASVGEIKYVFTSNKIIDLESAMNQFKKKFEEYIYGDLNDTLESIIVESLTKKKLIISVVESCTGGLLAGSITSVNGSSRVFAESIVTYSNEAKVKYLGVSLNTLNTHGAVSIECAYEMVDNLYNKTISDVCVSVTGIAGPTGGTKEKPVGLVFFGINYKGNTKTYKRIFNGNREMIRKRATIYALNLVRKELNQL